MKPVKQEKQETRKLKALVNMTKTVLQNITGLINNTLFKILRRLIISAIHIVLMKSKRPLY